MIDHHPYTLVNLSFSLFAQFWIFFVTFFLSFICCLVVLYHLLFDSELRRNLNNHVIIVLLLNTLFYELTSIPFHLSYYYLGFVWPSISQTCLIWMFIDGAFFTLALLYVSWASIEQYIFIFHDNWIRTRKKRFLIHYFPLVAIGIYCLLFYTMTILFPPCENLFQYNLPLCGRPICYYEMKIIGLWDTVNHNILPTLTIIWFSIVLLVKILVRKHRMRQQIQWRKHRKMTIQLLSISILYLALYIPPMLVEFLQQCCLSEEFGADFQLHAQFFSYYVICLLPFLTLKSIPKRKFKCERLFSYYRRRRQTIRPEILMR